MQTYGIKRALFKVFLNLYPIVPTYLYHVLFKKEFTYRRKRLKYFLKVNRYISGERIVEIAVVADLLKNRKFRNCLEVGDTLSNYYKFPHDIIDKYERRRSVINADAYSYDFGKEYDIILSISTIEHIGHDELEKAPEKSILTIKHLIEFLSKDGLLMITVPLRYNDQIDSFVKSNEMKFDIRFLQRVSFLNDWIEVSEERAFSKDYDFMHFRANSVAIIEIHSYKTPKEIGGILENVVS